MFRGLLSHVWETRGMDPGRSWIALTKTVMVRLADHIPVDTQLQTIPLVDDSGDMLKNFEGTFRGTFIGTFTGTFSGTLLGTLNGTVISHV